jgi:cytochrome b
MSKSLVWDIPTRLFHALFAVGFIAAAVVSLLLGEDSPLFPYHAIIGLAIALMVCLRVVWGLVGSRYARFSSFAFGPAAVGQYMKATLLGGGQRHVGHNPGSAYAIFAMLALMIGLAATGILMGRGSESAKEIHEVLAYVMVGVVIAHVLGVVLHTVRHRENIVASMIHGWKDADSSEGIRSSHPVAAAVGLIVVGAWSVGLVRNFDPTTQTTTLPILGASLQIGESENDGAGERGGAADERHEDDD